MAISDTKSFRFINLAILTLMILLMAGLISFVNRSMALVKQTNMENFSLSTKIRDASEELDIIFERAEVNINVLGDAIISSYDISKLHNKYYNENYIKTLDFIMEATIKNSPNCDGTWFQLNANMPFSSYIYSWYGFKNGKITNIRDIIEQSQNGTMINRTISPKDDPYYFEAVRNKTITWSKLYSDADTKTVMISVAKPLYKSGKLIGVIGTDVSLLSIQKALNRIQSHFPDSEIFMLNQDDEVMLSEISKNSQYASKKEIKKLKNLFIDKNESKSDKEKVVEYRDKKITKLGIKFELTNKYRVIISMPEKEIFKGFDRLFITMYVILATVILLIVTVSLDKQRIIRMNRILQNEKNKLRTIFDSNPNMIVVKDINGKYIDCNTTMLKFLNKTREEVIGTIDKDYFSDTELSEILQTEEMVKTLGKTVVGEFFYPGRNGFPDCYIEKYIVPLFNAENQITEMFILGVDVTKKRHEQDLLQRAKDNAEKTSLMKSSFLANMSHEIRTPMNGVIGFLQLLSETELTDEQAEFIKDAQKSSEMLLQIINDILDFSKIEADKMRIENIKFDIRTIVEEVATMAASHSKKQDLCINTLILSEIPEKVIGDPLRIKQILANLISNAVKFTPKGEVITTVRKEAEDDKNIIINFEVKDTGIGIEESKKQEIFESFTQGDGSRTRKYGGTGLGLTICQKLVELMNGKISVTSQPNKGSTFKVTIPFVKDPTEEIKPTSAILQGKNIIIATTRTSEFKIIKYYLEEEGCNVMASESIPDIIQQAKNKKINLILIDEFMQNSEKEGASSQLKQNASTENIPLILYESIANICNNAFLSEAGITECIKKPLKRNELIEICSYVISEKQDNESALNKTDYEKLITKLPKQAQILAVDDNEINLKLITRILTHIGLHCDTAIDGQEALESLSVKDYNLIFMDCQMPILDGYETTKAIRNAEEENQHIPIIAMTANALAHDEEKCRESGMDGYISKPLNMEKLLNVLIFFKTRSSKKFPRQRNK